MTRRFLSCQAGEFFLASAPSGTGVRAGSRFPATFFPLFQTCARKGQPTGRKKGVQYMNQLIQSKSFTTFIVLAMTLTCLGLLPNAQAVVPPPDGGYAGSNTAEGTDALLSLSSGIWNTALGFQALNHDTAGNQNTATGVRALTNDTNGGFNTATGVLSLFSNTSGFFNSATGAYSLANNISGNNNTANGYAALYRNSAGGNTANGYAALFSNTTGDDNTANGINALNHNNTGSDNTASGGAALFSNTTGDVNTAISFDALAFNTIGDHNTAIGFDALISNTAGTFNTAVGAAALANNTGIGNTALGAGAGSAITFGTNVIAIGNVGANLVGACFIGNIRGVTTANNNAVNVMIDSAGQLGTISSSRRFKKEIKLTNTASKLLLALKPVTFHYKSDATNRPEFGLIAEEVAEVNPDLVVRDENGEIYTVRYDAVNAMLLNEFLKEHRKVEQQAREMQEQQATIAQQRKDSQAKSDKLEATIAQQQMEMRSVIARLNEQAAQIQKVSTQLEVSKPAPRTVSNK